jgi:hypothetical protein
MVRYAPLWILVLAAHIPEVAQAQSTAAFSELAGRLKAGDTVYVTVGEGETRGRVAQISPTSLDLMIDGRQTAFDIASVQRVERERRSTGWGALIGLGAGGALSAICWNSVHHCGIRTPATDLVIGLAVAPTAGAAVGAFIKRRQTVFESRRKSSPQVTVAPVVEPARRGVRVSVVYRSSDR